MARLRFDPLAGRDLTTYPANAESEGGIQGSYGKGDLGSAARETVLYPDTKHNVVDDRSSEVVFGIAVPPAGMPQLDIIITSGSGDVQGVLGPGQRAEVASGVIAEDMRPRRIG